MPVYGLGDGIHLNAAGHDILYQRVLAKDIFGLHLPLPVKLKSFSGLLKDQKSFLQWTSDEGTADTHYFLQRSSDGTGSVYAGYRETDYTY